MYHVIGLKETHSMFSEGGTKSWVSQSTEKRSIFPLLSVSHVTSILKALLKKQSHGMLSYFGHLQNYLKIEGNLKIIILLREQNVKEIIINHKGTMMFSDGED